MNYIDINTLAKEVQDRLNVIATDLFTTNEVNRKVTFSITANHYEYDRMIMDDFDGTPIPATIGLITRTGTTMNEDFKSGTFVETYSVDIFAFKDDSEALEKIFDAYNYAENSNNYENIEGWAVFKQTERAMFVGEHGSKDGEDRERVEYNFAFIWSFILGGVLGDETILKIDNNIIDWLRIDLQSDKGLLSNQSAAKSTPMSMTGTRLIITIPAQITTANKNLFSDMIGKVYNKMYNIVWQIGTFHTHTKNYYIRGGGLAYEKRQMIGYQIILEEALQRTTFLIDGHSVLVKEYTFQRDINTEAKVNEDNQVNEQGTTTTWALVARLIHDGSSKSNELLANVLDEVVDVPHTITIGIPSITGVKTYYAAFKKGSYTEDENGGIMYEMTFVGRAA